MIIQPNLPSGFVIFSDDVREEVSGKLTIVGAYGGEMSVLSAVPAKVPVSVLVRYRVDPKTLPLDLTFRITRETKSDQVLLLESQMPIPEPPPEFEFPQQTDPDALRFIEVQFVVKFGGVEIAENCQIKVRAYVGDDEIRLGTLQVKLVSPPSAPE